MKVSKKERHRIILDIISKNEISTQDELVDMLKECKLSITQATVSRDIKELNIVKANTNNGRQKFVAMNTMKDSGTDRLLRVFSEATISSTSSGNFIIVKTLPGMAPACASAIDALNNDKIAGSIAGDDTIFVAITDIEYVDEIQKELMRFSKSGE